MKILFDAIKFNTYKWQICGNARRVHKVLLFFMEVDY